MITKCAIYITEYLIKSSGKDVCKDQFEVYVYGLECFLNTFVTVTLLFVWGIITHSLFFMLLWVVCFCVLRGFTGGAHAPTQLSCIVGSVFLGCMNEWTTVYLKQTVVAYIICIIIFFFFAPMNNKKAFLSVIKKWVYKISAIMIVCIGLALFWRLGVIKLTSTIYYAIISVSILLIIAQFQAAHRVK